MKRLFYLPLLLSSSLIAGCAILDPNSDSETGPHVYAFADCAPWDGPALNLIVTEGERSCEILTSELQGEGAPVDFTSLLLFGEAQPATGRSWEIDMSGELTTTTEGWGEQCEGGYDACTPVQRATVSFSASTDGVAVANLFVLYEDGQELNTRRPVRACSKPPIPLCG